MSHIDQIIVILGPPQSREEQHRFAQLAEKTSKTLEQVYIERVADIVEDLDAPEAGGSSKLDQFFSGILGSNVIVKNPIATYFEKKGASYPAITFSCADIVDDNSTNQIELITEIFRTETAKSSLARKLGMHLGLEAVEVFVTYGS
jgi:hypothetical protein